MQTAIYCRVSTEEQATEGFSIHAQKDKLTKYASINDWDIVDYYVDDGISGKNLTDRKEVSRLIEDVKKGKINNVLIYKLDRLTRSVKDLIYLIELFDSHNCTFNSQTEKIDTSNAVGRMFVKIIGIFAEFERENLAERVSLGYEQKTREGNYTNCNGVYGYEVNTKCHTKNWLFQGSDQAQWVITSSLLGTNYAFHVSDVGYVGYLSYGLTYVTGYSPVMALSADVYVSGTGTQSDPYVMTN